MTLQVRRITQNKDKGVFVPSRGSSIFLQETSRRTFKRARFDFGRGSKAWNPLVMLASIHVPIPHPFPSSFPPCCAFSLCFYRKFLQKLQEARNGFQKGSLANMIASSRVQKSSCNFQTPPPSSPCLHHNPSSIFHTMQQNCKMP